MQPDGVKRVNREAMCVARSARNPVTPCTSRIIAVCLYERSGLDSYMQTCRVCQIWKDELDVVGFRAWRETPGLRRRQPQPCLQFTPAFATIVGSIHRAQFRSRVERARVRGCKRHYVRLCEIMQCIPSRSPIAASKDSIAESFRSKQCLFEFGQRRRIGSACRSNRPPRPSFHRSPESPRGHEQSLDRSSSSF